MNLNEYGIFEYSKNGHSLDTLLPGHLLVNPVMNPTKVRQPANWIDGGVWRQEEERAMYSDNLDHTFLQLMIESEADAAPLGLINWFSVHPTSMPRTNQGGNSIALKRDRKKARKRDRKSIC